MDNLFNTSPEEKDRIRQLHESYKKVHGTTSLLKEQADRTIKGRTFDGKTKKPLLGTNIFVTERPNHKVTADKKAIFELSGIKPGETVSMSYDKNYNVKVLTSDEIDDYVVAGMSQFFLEPTKQEDDIGTPVKTPTIKGCIDPTALNFDQEMFENEDLLDCAGVDQRVRVADDSEIGFYFNNPDRPDQDNSCCEYWEGCMDEKATNYWKKDPEYKKLKPVTFKAAEAIQLDAGSLKALNDLFPGTDWTAEKKEDIVIPKQIKPCKKCCVYPPRGFREGIDNLLEDINVAMEDDMAGHTINVYESDKGRNQQILKKLIGNYKVDSVEDGFKPVKKGGEYIGYVVPLLPDTEAIRKQQGKCAQIIIKNGGSDAEACRNAPNPERCEERSKECTDKLKELNANDMELIIRFGKSWKDILTLKNYKDGAKTYLRRRHSTKRGERVYIGPVDFQEETAENIISYLKELNTQFKKVPQTS
tara:strand:+ start:888 stop:2309 length:1422 start_codon:yes stop_codon:yes gene_type:complete